MVAVKFRNFHTVHQLPVAICKGTIKCLVEMNIPKNPGPSLISIKNKRIILLMLPAMISKYSGTNTNSANQNQTASMRGRQLDQSKSRSKSPTSPAKPFKLPIQQF